VRLHTADAERRALFQAAFAQDDRLARDLRQALEAAAVEYDRKLAVEIEAADGAGPPFEVVCELRQPSRPSEIVEPVGEARLLVVRGKARQEAYTLTRPRTLIGRTEELTDPHHRIVRRNDVVFDEAADEANATVSRTHAHIRYDPSAREYRIVDDGSQYGTRIFPEGRAIDVPAGNRRGERLRPGDEIYLGRACLRFE
jgi:hypothetical protein